MDRVESVIRYGSVRAMTAAEKALAKVGTQDKETADVLAKLKAQRDKLDQEAQMTQQSGQPSGYSQNMSDQQGAAYNYPATAPASFGSGRIAPGTVHQQSQQGPSVSPGQPWPQGVPHYTSAQHGAQQPGNITADQSSGSQQYVPPSYSSGPGAGFPHGQSNLSYSSAHNLSVPSGGQHHSSASQASNGSPASSPYPVTTQSNSHGYIDPVAQPQPWQGQYPLGGSQSQSQASQYSGHPLNQGPTYDSPSQPHLTHTVPGSVWSHNGTISAYGAQIPVNHNQSSFDQSQPHQPAPSSTSTHPSANPQRPPSPASNAGFGQSTMSW